jgi:hypothetical protein
MKKTGFILVALISLGAFGCKKYLTTTPEDFVTPANYFSTEQQAQLALNGAFDYLSRQWWYAGYWQARMVDIGDDIYCTLTGQFPANFTSSASDPAFYDTWQVLYQCVEQCNVILANIDRVNMDVTKRGYIKGEALFLRAYAFFFLVDQWGPIPLKLKPTQDANDIAIPRSPIGDVYKQILHDMAEADSLVPPATVDGYGCNGFPAKTTVEGILARVCLKMAGHPLMDVSKYKDAKMWAEKVVNSHLHSLNPSYSQVFINMISNKYDKKESLWEVDFMDVTGKTEHGYTGYLDGLSCPNAAADSGTCVGQVRCTRVLYNLYGKGDLRRDWCIGTYYFYGSGVNVGKHDNMGATSLYERFPGKFRLNYSPAPRLVGRSPVNFPLLRYSDVLLMLAEADNAINHGPTPLAYSCINQVRERAYGKMLPGATDPTEADLPAGLDYEQFFEAIQDERAREFPSEGLRKHDMIRWGDMISRLRAVKADANNPSLPKPSASLVTDVNNIADRVSARDTLWPIPTRELTLNPKATQNPGW